MKKRYKKEKANNKRKKIDIHECLEEEGYDISYSTVCNYIKNKLDEKKEAYIRQEYDLGDVSEFDWGHVKLEIGGESKAIQMAVMTTARGNYRFAYLYQNQKMESFLDSHVRFFNHVGGVHKEIVYDNMKVAVAKFVSKTEKEPTEDLLKLSMYYGFKYRFCNARRGNEKDYVERSVEYVRRYKELLKVLMAASEGAPFIKTGGLGEVIGSLPKALREENIDVRVVLPKYMAIPAEYRDDIQYLKYIYVDVGWRHQYCGIEKYILDGLPVYFIDNEYYFGRDMIYGYDDDEPERYAFYCRAVLEILPHIDFMPDIIHCHDWQTGMIPVFLKANYMQDEFYRGIGTIFTIHNLKYQGIFSKDIMKELLGLDEEYYTSDKLEFYGGVSFMKGGLTYSDIISTVSPTYAQEIQTPFLGQKLDGLLRARRSELFGILNGIDYDVYNPAEDPLIYANYDSRDLRGKLEGKLKLQKRLGLPVREDVPIIAIITRLVSQKGLDLIESVLEEILAMDIQMIVMGDGEPHYEWLFRDGSHRYPHKLSANIYYENELAHKIYAGADMFLMPSLFEPCGLAQLFSLRYGTIPIVRETGGLKDTVQSYNEFTGEGNGFSFTDYNAHDMLYTIRRAIEYYYKEDIWDMLIRRGMTGDYSWKRSASKYIELYNMLKYHR